MRRLKWIKKKKQSSCFMHQITADSPYQTPSIYTYGLRECIWYYSLYSSLIFARLLGVDWKKSKTIGSKMMSGGTTEEWRNQHRRLMCEKTNLIERWWHVMTYAHTGAHIASANIVDIKLKCCAVMHNEQYIYARRCIYGWTYTNGRRFCVGKPRWMNSFRAFILGWGMSK